MEALLTSCSCSSGVSVISRLKFTAGSNSFSRVRTRSSLLQAARTPRKTTRELDVSSSSPQSFKSINYVESSPDVITCGFGAVSAVRPTEWVQKQFELPGFSRGCHIITRGIISAVPEIKEFDVGIAHIFVLHTSCSLTINENASPDVPLDMEDALNRIVPEGRNYRHLDEGLDDMPAHVKASMMGSSLTIPIRGGRLNLGMWQGIWLNEHRNYGGPRTICVTIQGQKRADGRVYK